MKHLWTVFCKHASIDASTKNISLVEITEQLNLTVAVAKDKYLVPFESALVTLWMRSDIEKPEKFFTRVKFRTPEGTAVEGPPVQIDLSASVRGRAIANQPGLPLTKAGFYEFEIETLDEIKNTWSKVASLPLQVDIAIAPPKVAARN